MKNTRSNYSDLPIVLITVIAIFLCVGWCINLYLLATANFEPPYANEAIRAVGVAVAPLGGIIGYIDIKD